LEVVSKLSDGDHPPAGELEEGAVAVVLALAPHERSPPVADPSEEPFKLPVVLGAA
jgi:hypothetical protein